jgi:hypothetical protein
MERIVNIAKNHKEAEKWDIEQQINMTPRERQMAAKELKKRFYGSNPPDLKDCRQEFRIYYIGLNELIKNKKGVN